MERFTKPVFIFLLLSISISASIFMIVESGSFFQGLYKAKSSISFMGYWAAFLNEVFMGIMAAVWLPGKKDKQKDKIHPVNVLFKILLVFLFITTVCGSSLKTVFPLYSVVQQQENQKSVIQILETQVKDNQQSLNTFVQQNQRVNAALSVQNQVKIKEELKQFLLNQKSTFGLWIEISIVIFIRFGVQLANLSCIWLAGWVYRQPIRNSSDELFPKNSNKDAVAPRFILDPKTLKTKTLKKNGHKRTINGTDPFQESNTNVHPPGQKPIPSYKGKQNQANGGQKSASARKPLGINVRLDDRTKIYDLRTKIARLLRSRNEGISLSDVGKAIGEKESNLREIVNPKTSFGNASMPALQSILTKIENLYNEEQVRMF